MTDPLDVLSIQTCLIVGLTIAVEIDDRSVPEDRIRDAIALALSANGIDPLTSTLDVDHLTAGRICQDAGKLLRQWTKEGYP